MTTNETSTEKSTQLAHLKEEMEKDETLPLKKDATRLVFGEGNPDAEILFIGEGPGYWEDQKGIPFVGNAGALLNQLLALLNISRPDVFITNVVHYRPPSNRDPEPSEIAAFQPYLDKIIQIIDPLLIVTLGRFSMGKFLPGATISGVHGKVRDVMWKGQTIAVLPMYHPAAALRNGEIKTRLKDDFLTIPVVLEEIKKAKEENKTESEKPEQIKLI
jgi:uracil-DNA glycosylase